MAAAWHVPTWLQHSQVVLDRTVFLPQGQYLSVNTVEEPYEYVAVFSITKMCVSGVGALIYSSARLWKNTLAYPATATVLSAFVLSLQLLSRASPIQRLYAKVTKSDVQKETGEDLEAVGTDGQRPSHIQRLGGPVIFAFKTVRLLSTLALLALSIASIAVNGTDDDDDDSYNARWVAFAITGTYVCPR